MLQMFCRYRTWCGFRAFIIVIVNVRMIVNIVNTCAALAQAHLMPTVPRRLYMDVGQFENRKTIIVKSQHIHSYLFSVHLLYVIWAERS